jgi:hypothetical protein
MSKLAWDQVGQRLYETGISKGVLFTQKADGSYNTGVAWNGLVSVNKSPEGGEDNAIYADNMKYLSLTSAENLNGSISAYTYPEEFEACDGSSEVKPGLFVGQQTRVPFALAYITIVGNDTQGNAYGEKLHIIYNSKVAPSERSYETVNEDPSAITFSWNFTTTPVDLSDVGLNASAGIVIDKVTVGATVWNSIIDKIHGAAAQESQLPTIPELIAMAGTGVAEVASLTVTAAATTAGNATVTLNGTATNVALTTSDNTATLVATKIRATSFTGWTTGGTGAVVTFTSTTTGVKTDATYSAGTTGATGTMTTTTQGA